MTRPLEVNWDAQTKKCGKCGEFKPFSAFYKMKSNKMHGLGPWCKPCMDAKRKGWAKANPERQHETGLACARRGYKTRWQRRKNDPKRIAYMREYHKRYAPENAEKIKAKNAVWHLRHKERRNADVLAKYYANREEWWARNKAWAKAHPEAMNAYTRQCEAKRRAAKLKAPGSWTEKDIKKLYELQRGKCMACRCDLSKSFHRDHIVALSKGGSNDISNIQLLCKSCNSRKHAKDWTQFLQENGYLI